MIKELDNILDQITMYRLVLYYLLALLGAAAAFSIFGLLSFSPISLILSTVFIVVVCYVVNKIFSIVFNAPTNIESAYITALILALIVSPAKDPADYITLFWIGAWAMASKYIFAVGKKHIFNPAALAVFLTSITIAGVASWWVGTLVMLPFTLAGMLIVRKIRRFELVFYFFIASLVTVTALSALKGSDPLVTLKKTFVDSPILFFAFIMLTEPLTTPPTKKLQAIYGIIVGFLFAPQLQFAGFYTTPEMALLAGNVFSFIVSPKYKLMLKLKNKFQETDDICNFYFPRPKNFVFVPGQYMEWTLPNVKFDARGNRRYFTIASSPTEDVVQLGVRFENNGSQFKKSLDGLTDKTPIIATGLSGDFTLPADKTKKLVFIAGGIGVTPYRSIIKYLIDKNERRDIVLFYSNKTESEIVYKDVFADASKRHGIKTIYVLTGEKTTKSGFESGRITEGVLKKTMSDYNERTYYISGPQAMVDSYKSLLKSLHIPDKQIVTDYFPGFA